MIGIIKAVFYMLFVLLIAQIVNFIYSFLVFYVKKRKNYVDKHNSNVSLNMLQCDKCKVFISKNEAYMSNGKVYCSKDHSV
jgi:uncharacterized protein